MKIKNAEFVVSQSDFTACKDYGIPEFAIAGKSNVGKSSFINMMANITRLAKTSSTPGRTRLLNYFKFNNGEFLFVDLPGYGYAKIAESGKEGWDKLIGGYFQTSKNLLMTFMLLDIRHEPSALDKQMIAYLHHFHIPFTIIATKSDKLSRTGIVKQKQILARALTLTASSIVAVSALKKTGIDEVLLKIQQAMDNRFNFDDATESDGIFELKDAQVDSNNISVVVSGSNASGNVITNDGKLNETSLNAKNLIEKSSSTATLDRTKLSDRIIEKVLSNGDIDNTDNKYNVDNIDNTNNKNNVDNIDNKFTLDKIDNKDINTNNTTYNKATTADENTTGKVKIENDYYKINVRNKAIAKAKTGTKNKSIAKGKSDVKENDVKKEKSVTYENKVAKANIVTKNKTIIKGKSDAKENDVKKENSAAILVNASKKESGKQ